MQNRVSSLFLRGSALGRSLTPARPASSLAIVMRRLTPSTVPPSTDDLFASVRARLAALLGQEGREAEEEARLKEEYEACAKRREAVTSEIGRIRSTLAALAGPSLVLSPGDELPPLDDLPATVAPPSRSLAAVDDDDDDSAANFTFPAPRVYKRTRQNKALEILTKHPGRPYELFVIDLYGEDNQKNRKRLRALMWQMKRDGLVRPIAGTAEDGGVYEVVPRDRAAARERLRQQHNGKPTEAAPK